MGEWETSWIIVVVLLITDVLLVWLGYQWGRKSAARVNRGALQADMMALGQAMDGLGTCLTTVNSALAQGYELKAVQKDAEQPEQPEQPERAEQAQQAGMPEQPIYPREELSPYKLAGRLAATGASVEEIMSQCQLPRSEAQVLVNMASARVEATSLATN